MTKLTSLTEDFAKALGRLKEALEAEETMIVRDAAIQRFEFTFDLAWKSMKTYLEERKGIICRSPKGCIREAYAQGLIEHDEMWLKLTDMRNLTAHTYREDVAREVYAVLPSAIDRFEKLLSQLKV